MSHIKLEYLICGKIVGLHTQFQLVKPLYHFLNVSFHMLLIQLYFFNIFNHFFNISYHFFSISFHLLNIINHFFNIFRQYLEHFIEKLPIDTERKAYKVLSVCEKRNMSEQGKGYGMCYFLYLSHWFSVWKHYYEMVWWMYLFPFGNVCCNKYLRTKTMTCSMSPRMVSELYFHCGI